MNSPLTTVKRLLGVITLDQAYIEFAFPILTLVFFDPDSRILPTNTDYATRGIWYGICISTPYFINLFFAPIISTLSDEFGRRKFLLFEISSAFLYLLLAGVAVLTGQLWLLISAFVLRGAFSRTNTTALAIIGDACTKQQKLIYMGHIQTAMAFGACLGPITSGIFAKRFYFEFFNFSLPFFIAALLAFTNILLTYFLITETLQTRASQMHAQGSRWQANWHAIKYVVTHRDVLKISLFLLLFQITWSAYYQFVGPLVKTVYHFSPEQLSLFIGLMAFWLVIGAGPIFKLLRIKLTHQQLLVTSGLIELFGIALTLAIYYEWLPSYYIWAATFPVAVGDVLAYICLTTFYSNVVPGYMQGKVMGINFLIVGLVWGATGRIGGIILGHSPIIPILLAPLGVIAAILFINTNFGRKLSLNYAC